MGMNKERLVALDALRGFAALGIAFFWHYQHLQPQYGYPFSKKAFWFYHYGWNLVDFFFVLSGFIITYIYKDEIAKKKTSFSKFSILRLSRLYPLHIITLLVVALLQITRKVSNLDFFIYKFNDVYHFLLNVFFIQYGWFESGYSFNAPSWSISTEIFAYLLFFMILHYFYDNKKHLFFSVGIIFIGLGIMKLNVNFPLVNSSMGRVFIGFFIGSLLFEFHRYINTMKNKIIPLIICSVTLSIIACLGIVFGHDIYGNWPIVYTVLIYPTIILLVLNIKFINRCISIRPFHFLGKISYSIYLWHFPVQLIIKTIDEKFHLNLNYSSRLIFLCIVAITLLLSAISYRLFEMPMQQYLRRKYECISLGINC